MMVCVVTAMINVGYNSFNQVVKATDNLRESLK